MPPDNNGERIAKLEAMVETLVASVSSRGDLEGRMMEKLGGISEQLSWIMNSQKTSDAKFDAHDVRIKTLENALGGFNTARKALVWFIVAQAGVIAFLVTVTLEVMKRGS